MVIYSSTNPLIYTVKDKCRVCYTCVRGCPAKALKISGGQAEVITERCIACGNCIKVCSQEAKEYKKSIDEVKELINSEYKTVACIAPSFPAEFIYNNLLIQVNVINASYKYGVKKLLFLGSSCIYPKHADQPMKENALLSSPLEPTNEAYAIAKIAGLKMCRYYNR